MPQRTSVKRMTALNLIRSATRPDTHERGRRAGDGQLDEGVTVGSKNRPPNLNHPGITQLALFMIL